MNTITECAACGDVESQGATISECIGAGGNGCGAQVCEECSANAGDGDRRCPKCHDTQDQIDRADWLRDQDR